MWKRGKTTRHAGRAAPVIHATACGSTIHDLAVPGKRGREGERERERRRVRKTGKEGKGGRRNMTYIISGRRCPCYCCDNLHNSSPYQSLTTAPMILLIAYGNPLRRDDGAGHVLADRLEKTWRGQGLAVQRLDVLQLTPELATEIADPAVDLVVFADAQPGCPGRGPALILQMLRPATTAPAPRAASHPRNAARQCRRAMPHTPAGLADYRARSRFRHWRRPERKCTKRPERHPGPAQNHAGGLAPRCRPRRLATPTRPTPASSTHIGALP